MKVKSGSTMKTKSKILLLITGAIIALALLCFGGGAALAADVSGEDGFIAAVAGVDPSINVVGDITLTSDVTIGRAVTVTSDNGSTINTGGSSLIISAGGDVIIEGNLTVAGSGEFHQTIYVDGGLFNLNSGTIEITGAFSAGIYVTSGTANISGGEVAGDRYGVYVEGGTADISGGQVTGGQFGVLVEGGTADLSGGTIAGTDSGDSKGVYVKDSGTVNISGGEVAGDRYGVYVEGGLVTISGTAEIRNEKKNEDTIHVCGGGTANISGGTITAAGENSAGVYVEDGTVSVSGGEITAVTGFGYGMYVTDGTVTVSGGTVTGFFGVRAEGGTVTISGGIIKGHKDYGYDANADGGTVIISGGAFSGGYGGVVCKHGGEASISVSPGLAIEGGVWGYDSVSREDRIYLTALPGPVTMTAGETETVELMGVDTSISFAIDAVNTSAVLAASISGNTVTLKPPVAAIPGTYTLTLTSVNSYDPLDPDILKLIIPVTVEAPTYTVTYNGNGGNGVTPTEEDQEAGAIFIAAANSFTAPAGKQFKEWNTAADGTGTAYAAGAKVFMPGNDLTLYAIWEDLPVFTVTFEKNGGDSEANPTGKTAVSGGNIGELPAAPTRSGYTFNGWNTLADGSGTAFTAATVVTGDLTVYAQWKVQSSSGGSDSDSSSTGSPMPKQSISRYLDAAAGGQVSLEGVTVSVPAGTLPQNATLSITKLTDNEVENYVPAGLQIKLGLEERRGCNPGCGLWY
jgi:uncharacterized repeat protein (TIGR02543 family)